MGCCGGFKRQPPLSYVIGQYNTPSHKQFSSEDQLKLKREFMALFNCYVSCAEAETKELLPQEYAQQAQLRTLLNRHPVFRQHYGLEPWFAGCTDESYVGCGLESKIFTNAYISFGSRSRDCHTDYRNPSITHLTTRLRGHWDGTVITGQTVLFDRYGTRAVVVDDSMRGRRLVGGLNIIKHANMGPKGDVITDKGLLK